MKSNARHKCIFVDLETGGTDPTRHPITEIAAIAVEAGTWREIESIEIKVEFSARDADPIALGINKYSPSIWERYAISEEHAAKKFALFCRRHATIRRVGRRSKKRYRLAQLAGHDAERFDGPFLRRWYRRQQIFFPATPRVLDTKQLAMWFFEQNQGLTPPNNYKLRTLCDYFDIPAPDHTALRDIRATLSLAQTISSHQMSATLVA